jgi:soluble lytic murein transglycosylase-like protein
MKIPSWVWIAGSLGVLYALSRTQAAQTLATSAGDTVTATLSGWKTVEQGPVWVPILNGIEDAQGLPRDLLARIAYQESRFRPDVISGTTVSSAGARGLMQLMPQYFTTVQRPTPFSQQDSLDQANQAATLLVNLYNHFQDWGLAIAAYNDGQGNIDQFVAGARQLPAETSTYVAQVLADVPLASSLSNA